MKFTLYSKEGCSYCKKAERWAKKQKFPISFLTLGIIAYLKKVWINVKIENTMKSVDADIEKIHELWDEEETEHRMNVIAQNGNDGLHYSETPSEVDGLNAVSYTHLTLPTILLV